MKKKRLLTVVGICLALVLATLLIAGCAEEEAPPPAAPPPEEEAPPPAPPQAAEPEVIEWKFQYMNIAESPQFEACEWWARWVEESSGGRLKITVYPAGQIVEAADYIDALRENIVQMASPYGGYYKDNIPEGGLQAGLPMTFRSSAEGQYVFYEKGLLEVVREAFAEHGCEVYSVGGGTTIPIWAKKPLVTLEDFEGLKVRASGDYSKMLANIGAQPVYLSTAEGLAALQLGTVDAWEAGFHDFQSYKHYELCKYVMQPALYGAGMDMFAISTEALKELPEDLRPLLMAQAPVLNWAESWRADLAAVKMNNMLPEWGVELVQMSDEVVEAMTNEGLLMLDEYSSKSARCAEGVEIIKSVMREMGYID